MKIVSTFTSLLEANLARITLEGAGVPSVVSGIELSMQGGATGVQVIVPDDCIESAIQVLTSHGCGVRC